MPNLVLGTAAYLATALMLFAGFISAYLVLRGSAVSWPPLGQPRLPLAVTTANSAVLLASGYCMLRAARARGGGARGGAGGGVVAAWLRRALLLGAVFVAVQGIEWARLVRFGLLTSAGTYAGIFYTLVGTHALHALGGLVFLALTARLPGDGARLQACALYWGFVVIIWPALYALVFMV